MEVIFEPATGTDLLIWFLRLLPILVFVVLPVGGFLWLMARLRTMTVLLDDIRTLLAQQASQPVDRP